MRKLSCNPQIEVLGAPLIAFVDNLDADETQPYLDKHGLSEIDPDKWYPMQKWLDVLNDMSEGTNLSSHLVAIGLEIIKNIRMPPEMESASLVEILNGWDDLYHMQHRGGDIGYVKTEKVTDTHYKTIHKHLYPDDMVYGIAYGMAKRFMPEDTHIIIYYDKDVPRLDAGGTETIIHIKW